MYISQLHVRQFRTYTDATHELSSGVTVIVGPNGSGKTNLLEALYVLATGKSFRDSDEYLTQHGEEWWALDGLADGANRAVRYQQGEKTYHINNTVYKRMGRQMALPVVLFDPDHLMVVHGPPSGRRKYLDQCIAQLVSGYASVLRRYERVIAQRNRLLKQPRLDQDELFAWDVSLVKLAGMIVAQRFSHIQTWNELLSYEYQRIAERADRITVQYRHDPDQYAHALLQQLKHSFEKDRLLGSTTVGPHRDDYSFQLGGRDMTVVASRGEIRTLLLALKYTEAAQLQLLHDTPPVLLLDDVFSELDDARQKQLISGSSVQNQIVMTTTHNNPSIRRAYQVLL